MLFRFKNELINTFHVCEPETGVFSWCRAPRSRTARRRGVREGGSSWAAKTRGFSAVVLAAREKPVFSGRQTPPKTRAFRLVGGRHQTARENTAFLHRAGRRSRENAGFRRNNCENTGLLRPGAQNWQPRTADFRIPVPILRVFSVEVRPGAPPPFTSLVPAAWRGARPGQPREGVPDRAPGPVLAPGPAEPGPGADRVGRPQPSATGDAGQEQSVGLPSANAPDSGVLLPSKGQQACPRSWRARQTRLAYETPRFTPNPPPKAPPALASNVDNKEERRLQAREGLLGASKQIRGDFEKGAWGVRS